MLNFGECKNLYEFCFLIEVRPSARMGGICSGIVTVAGFLVFGAAFAWNGSACRGGTGAEAERAATNSRMSENEPKL